MYMSQLYLHYTIMTVYNMDVIDIKKKLFILTTSSSYFIAPVDTQSLIRSATTPLYLCPSYLQKYNTQNIDQVFVPQT